MAYSVRSDRDPSTRPLMQVALFSIGAHVLLLIIFPLAMKLFYHPAAFDAVRTVELVRLSPPRAAMRSAPRPAKPEAPVVEKSKPLPKAETKPVPRTSKPKPVEQPKKIEEQESVDELAGLLEGLDQPAVDVSALTSNFKYPWYINNIRSKVERNWTPPVENPDVFIEVVFSIFRDGTISQVSISHGSGQSSLDNLAIRAITLAAPFGKLPAGFDGDQLDVTYTLRPVRK